jgi:hypothetical protein
VVEACDQLQERARLDVERGEEARDAGKLLIGLVQLVLCDEAHHRRLAPLHRRRSTSIDFDKSSAAPAA